MKKLILALLLLATAAHAQAPVKQSGNVTPGHVAMWTTNGVIQDAGPATQGFLTSVGVVAQGPSICARSGPPSGAYNLLCLGVTPTGGQITFNNVGATGTLSAVINGNTYNIPFTPPATAVQGPNLTTVGDVMCWNNTQGTLAADCPTFTATGTTTGRSLQNHFTDHINVKDFGAVCDGVTDDTAAFNAAATYASNVQANSNTAVIEMVGVCLISNITWPGGPNKLLTISGQLLVSDPKGLNLPQGVEIDGYSGGGTPQFSDGGLATIAPASNSQVNATFTGTGSGYNLTASGPITGTIVNGGVVTGTGIPVGTIITHQTSGTPGGAGVYITNHQTTVSGATTEHAITVRFSRPNGGIMRNIFVGVATSGTGIYVDGTTFASCGGVTMTNVGSEPNNDGGVPLIIQSCLWVKINQASFLTQTSDGPSIIFAHQASEQPNGLMTFDNVWISGHGVEVNGGGDTGGAGDSCLSSSTFRNFVFENMIDAGFTLAHNGCLNNVNFERVTPADNISQTAFIDNTNGATNVPACTDVSFFWSAVGDAPALVKVASPPCSVYVDGNFEGNVNFGPAEQRNVYFQWGQTVDSLWLGKGTTFGPQATPIAPFGSVQQNPANWSGPISGTLTQNVLAPDGTTHAATLVPTSSNRAEVFAVNGATISISTGGWIVGGVWARCDGTTSLKPVGGAQIGLNNATFDDGTTILALSNQAATWSNCGWKPFTGAGKIASVSGSVQIDLDMFSQGGVGGGSTQFFNPWLVYIPPSTTSDDEVLRWARHLANVVSTAPQGTAATRQSLFLDTGAVYKQKGTAFASLPSPNAGDFAYVTDGLAASCGDSSCTTWGTTITGGGGFLKLLAWYNGSNWTLVGK